ncbi:MAG TPA: hypothetical protein VF995_01670 [Actinomycetota bacterium]
MGRTRLLVHGLSGPLGLLALPAAILLLGLALGLAGSGSAAAQTSLGLRGVSCDRLTVSGEGLSPSTRFTLTILNPADLRALAQRTVTTSAAGTLATRVSVSLSGLRAVRAALRRPGAAPIWADQSLPAPCPLASTGGGHTAPLLAFAVAALAGGVVLVNAYAYHGRHLVAAGRHARS